MREIKFRAWDLIDKVMYYNVQNGISFDDGSVYEFCKFLGTQFQTEGDYHEWELMQYTGLKDKNGKEIYEGDIVQYVDDDGSVINGQVEMFRYQWGLSDDYGFYPFCYQIQTNRADYHEVIGNIYEHKNLLDTNKQENEEST
jgi:ribosomal protein L35AE/L33A